MSGSACKIRLPGRRAVSIGAAHVGSIASCAAVSRQAKVVFAGEA